MDKPKDIDDYIAGFPEEVQKLLQEVRETVQSTAPDATEKISYGMPTFALNGNLVYFAAFKNHIGFYALPSGTKAFREELATYKTGKGSIQFPFDRPLPLKLIQQIVKFRIAENEEKAKLKKKK
ncbi:hypothetical protein HYN59_00165 [Flavobacterium album]|uniref:YdhG-like domain-containing protein n=1 Tax=Flavobacterium album TaxID=2175091 RepID=A0A2S1QTB2_9FLAO|nr:DUF1801 domain-containing protein [Flavobacterium album]AWH83623.1 hypothetical protein HYN59_00165 [Flavobacterium album]